MISGEEFSFLFDNYECKSYNKCETRAFLPGGERPFVLADQNEKEVSFYA